MSDLPAKYAGLDISNKYVEALDAKLAELKDMLEIGLSVYRQTGEVHALVAVAEKALEGGE